MERDQAIAMLVTYALRKGLIQPCEEIWATNALLGVLKLDSYTPPETEMPADIDLPYWTRCWTMRMRAAYWRKTPSSTAICLIPR